VVLGPPTAGQCTAQALGELRFAASASAADDFGDGQGHFVQHLRDLGQGAGEITCGNGAGVRKKLQVEAFGGQGRKGIQLGGLSRARHRCIIKAVLRPKVMGERLTPRLQTRM
jgi:hypothetical protein